MKKLLPVLTVFILIIIIVSIFLSMSSQKKMVTIQEGNHEHKPLDITLNHYQDTQCGMTIETLVHSVQAVAPDGKTWFFDDVGCFALWYKNIKFQKEATIWVYTNDTNRYINGRKAWYNKIDKTPMGYGFGAYEKEGINMIPFDEMLLKMYRGENLTNPLIRKKLLSE
ncbi:hypothetical protein [Halarcobacter anaerophilus]|jgi:hypothetical protein|uniref:Nitrous oxide reductase accessory protein NosL n=1 Tax=Halarcobacter anaerophilus TaxID=877500 RepID=A0A4Q0Y2T4_9BACT|nr:hypothetical protein [Halarcobacter anaerophilus]QDF29140.1 hypothetical protein AANAER_1664 [Halarcobacter anaerophilus]RXJ64397.1 hypothetical protein CRV06_00110 [Halarcobacter anaerophilus]